MTTAFNKILTAGAVVAALALPLATNADPAQRVERQHQRIKQGVESGQLTKGEAKADRARLKAVNEQRQAWLKAQGGKLTPTQEAQLQRELNGSSRNIFYTKHNLTNRPGAPDPHFAPKTTLPGGNMQGADGNRVQEQWDRLQQGVENGSLTQREFDRSRARLQYINRQRMDWLQQGNGTLTPDQQAQLNRELNHSSNDTWWSRHNLPDQPGT